jgi:hypothetical protein
LFFLQQFFFAHAIHFCLTFHPNDLPKMAALSRANPSRNPDASFAAQINSTRGNETNT